jgi:hypothetical protein
MYSYIFIYIYILLSTHDYYKLPEKNNNNNNNKNNQLLSSKVKILEVQLDINDIQLCILKSLKVQAIICYIIICYIKDKMHMLVPYVI